MASDDELEQARERGRDDALQTIAAHAPAEPLLRVAWAVGYGAVDEVQAAVDRARADGATWQMIGQAAGINWRTAQSRWGSGPDRQRRYRERKASG
jgi:hypothetical protein